MNQQNAIAAGQALVAAGCPAAFLPLALAQAAVETAGFNSNVSATDNNLSGIMYIGKPSVQKNAVQGSAFPPNESKTAHYARFASVQDWAVDYLRILSIDKGAGRPIDSTNTADLAATLKANGYYTATQSSYAAALASWANQMNAIAASFVGELKKKAR